MYGVVAMKKKIMGKRKLRAVPFWLVVLLAIGFIIVSFRISAVGLVPERILQISSILAMPESAAGEIGKLKEDALAFLRGNMGSAPIPQRDGTLNDMKSDSLYSGDISQTPEDILRSMEKVREKFDKGEYTQDGEVIEKTFTSNQATDSYGNVHIRNVTDSQSVDIESILSDGCSLPVDHISEPTVLIYHTHSTESYIMTDNGRFSSAYPSRNDSKSVNMIRVGDEITKLLESQGIGVIHDRSIYDTVYTGAYSKSREGVLSYLEKYPSIVITLDIHRDAVFYDDLTHMKPVTDIDGMKAAQMMIIAGAEGGSVDDFSSWQTNLSFAVMLQKAANDKYENLMKPIYFCNRKYNMDVTPYSLLIEIGTDVNTLEEAAYSGRLLGDVLADFIKGNAVVEK